MDPLHKPVTWYEICDAGWQATDCDIRDKKVECVKLLSLGGFWILLLSSMMDFVPCDQFILGAPLLWQNASLCMKLSWSLTVRNTFQLFATTQPDTANLTRKNDSLSQTVTLKSTIEIQSTSRKKVQNRRWLELCSWLVLVDSFYDGTQL